MSSMKIYKSNIPSVDIPECSIYSHVFSSVDKFPPTTPAFIDAATGTTVTRADLRRLTLELGWGLRNELSRLGGPTLTRGDTVLIFSPNSIAYPVLLFGSIAAGLRCTLANSGYTPKELLHQYADSGAKLIFTHLAMLPVVVDMLKLAKVDAKEARSRIVVVDWLMDEKAPKGLVRLDDLLGKGKLDNEEKFDGPLTNETVLLCYSSGTTGKPKGVETTHRNLVSVLSIMGPIFTMDSGNDRSIGVLPFYHIYGAVNLLQYPLFLGVPVIVMPRFEPVAFCQTIERYKITIGLIVPPILVVLARHPAAEQFDLTSLKLLVSGAAPLGAPLVKAVMDRLRSRGNSGLAITQGYGLTETSPTCHLVPTAAAEKKVGFIGVLLPNLETRLVVDDTRDAQEGEAGELWIRGPSIMKGYLNNPSATKNSITEDRWFKTGDVAIIDNDGFYKIVDRQKELIKYKGFQVPPAELESVLLQHPDIADSGVVGIESHAEATELPRAYVVHAKGLSSDDEKRAFSKSVQKWIEGHVAKHKFLRGGVVVVDAIPKSASGKILRRELKERAKQEVAAEEAKAAAPKAKL